MKSSFQRPTAICAPCGLILALIIGVARMTEAQTLWTGPMTNFTQSATSEVDVLIPGAVSLQRDVTQWLFNPAGGDGGPALNTPTDTEWAFGLLANYDALGYQTFWSLRDGDLSAVLVGNPMVVHLINEDVYLALTFSAWPQHGNSNGFFSYTRSTPAVAPAPSVTITNPANNSVFAAPASVRIAANATVSSGSVTNVAFFSNGSLLGAVGSPSSGVTVGSLGAGAYALTAVATAAGISATSSVVNITIVAPIAITLSSQRITNSQFAFSYAVNPGLSYVVQSSSNLVNWVSLVTNIPGSSPVRFRGGFSPNGAQYYRVGRLPNP
jgi:Bacterial Ig domain